MGGWASRWLHSVSTWCVLCVGHETPANCCTLTTQQGMTRPPTTQHMQALQHASVTHRSRHARAHTRSLHMPCCQAAASTCPAQDHYQQQQHSAPAAAAAAVAQTLQPPPALVPAAAAEQWPAGTAASRGDCGLVLLLLCCCVLMLDSLQRHQHLTLLLRQLLLLLQGCCCLSQIWLCCGPAVKVPGRCCQQRPLLLLPCRLAQLLLLLLRCCCSCRRLGPAHTASHKTGVLSHKHNPSVQSNAKHAITPATPLVVLRLLHPQHPPHPCPESDPARHSPASATIVLNTNSP